jgi:prepilin-type processing-associated H-X9-DG protein
MIQFRCPCGKMLQAKEEYAGYEITCPQCGATMAVPAPDAIRPAATPLPAPLPLSEHTTDRPPPPLPAGAAPGGSPRPRRSRVELSGKALTALILGCLTFILPVVLAIPAILLAILALRDIAKRPAELTGKGLAITGLILGVVGNITVLPIVLIYQSVGESRAKIDSRNNLKLIVSALHNYHDTFRAFPPAVVRAPDGRPLYSWRVAILPFIEQEPLYRRFKLDEPWDSPNNKPLLQQMPPLYAPVRGSTPEPFCTYYQFFTGPNTPFPELPFQPGSSGRMGPRLMQFTDGSSNTILVAEAGEAVPWTKPVDIAISPARPLPPLGGMWRNGFNVAMADGSVRWVDTRRVSEPTLRAAISPAGGEILPPDWDQ